MSELDKLIERLERARGPDRELDAAIFGFDKPMAHTTGPTNPRMIESHPIPDYTASLDAAVALVERELPGWSWMARWSRDNADEQHYGAAYVKPLTGDDEGDFVGCASTPALSLCLATLRALAKADRAAEEKT